MTNNKHLLIIFVVMALLLIGVSSPGCVGPTPSPSVSPTTSPTPMPTPLPGPNDIYVSSEYATQDQTLALTYEGYTTPIGYFVHDDSMPGGVYLCNDTGYAAIDPDLYRGWIRNPVIDGHHNYDLLLINGSETSTARFDRSLNCIETSWPPKHWWDVASSGQMGTGAKVVVIGCAGSEKEIKAVFWDDTCRWFGW